MATNSSSPKIIYVAGYGRSGSTILDIVLGNHPDIVGVGEVSLLLDEWQDLSRRCSCGEIYSECDFWGGLLKQGVSREINHIVRKVEAIESLPRLLADRFPEEDRSAYQKFQRELFAYIQSRSGNSIIIDSSKSARFLAGRFLALHELANLDVFVLHLVRDGLDTLASLLVTGRNWTLEGYGKLPKPTALRCSMGWISANIFSSILSRSIGDNRYLQMKYEFLLENPEEALRKIGGFVGFNPECIIEKIQHEEGLAVGHQVGGNRIRLQSQVKLQKRKSDKKRKGLNSLQRLTFYLLGGWLQRLYGYPLRTR